MKQVWLFMNLLTMAGVPAIVSAQKAFREILKTKEYTVYADSIVQENKYTANILSPTAVTSNYSSHANKFKSPIIYFRFSINGKDNEMASTRAHSFACINSECETPVIKFGTPLKNNISVPENTYLAPNTKFRIRMDIRDVFQQFDKLGYYTTFNGNKIYKEDFKGIYVAGTAAPMIWDFDNLVNHPQLQLKDDDGDHIYETTLLLNAKEDEKKTDAHWQLTKDISAFPQYQSPYPVSDALYNMSLEEMIKAVEPDSTFRTGKEWAGVWTRDISYSIILSMAYLRNNDRLLIQLSKNLFYETIISL